LVIGVKGRRFWCYYATDKNQAYCTDLYIRKISALLALDKDTINKALIELIQELQDFTKAQLEAFKPIY